MTRALALIIIGISASCYAQEEAPSVIIAELGRADLVIVGTLRQDFKFPWIDGWNERGHIEAERTLKGSAHQPNLPFAWERDFRAGWCLIRPDWRGAIGQRGIWVLTRDGDRYRAPSLWAGFLDLKRLDEILKALAEVSSAPASP
jgi:hypothetical protein